jgi:hypothetical protein
MLGREDIFKPTTGNNNLHEICNDNGVRAANFATSRNPTVKSTMLPHRNIHKFTWTSPNGKMHNQTDILIERRWHLSILDLRPFRGTDCDTDHYLENLKTMWCILIELGKLLETIKISAKESIGYYELKKHKPWFEEG